MVLFHCKSYCKLVSAVRLTKIFKLSTNIRYVYVLGNDLANRISLH